MTDKELIEKAQGGDKEAFAELVRRYYRGVYNLAYKLTTSREDAMDITQEVFLRVYRAFGTFEAEKPFQPWLYRITWNICADRGRRLVRSPPQETIGSAEPAGVTLANPGPGPDASYETKEIGDVLKAAISRLADGYRELVVLFHLEGLSIREISQVTGMKETVIKNRLYRARQMLRKELEGLGFTW